MGSSCFVPVRRLELNHEAQHAKSSADFISKIEGATQECEETRYWLDLLHESGIVPVERLSALKEEASQLIAILVTIGRKAKNRLQQKAI